MSGREMEISNFDEKNGVATSLQIGEIQMKTRGRLFKSIHADHSFVASETPKFLAEFMVKLAEIGESSRVLEPSAGKGNIVEEVVKVTNEIQCVELNFNNVEILKNKGFNVIHGDFLKLNNLGMFDAVLMCPPKNSIPHIEHALKFLKPNGKLVGLVREDSKGLENYRNFYHPLDLKFVMNNEFVPSGLLFMEK